MTYRHITAEEAKEIMDSEKNIVILDVRTQEEYGSGHIRGAVCLPNEEIMEEPKELTDKAQKILVYCRSGKRYLFSLIGGKQFSVSFAKRGRP